MKVADLLLQQMGTAPISSFHLAQESVKRILLLVDWLLMTVITLDMIFEDDTKLFGLMQRYSDEEEIDELKRQVIAYVKTQIHDVPSEI